LHKKLCMYKYKHFYFIFLVQINDVVKKYNYRVLCKL
jgi:hypothetical protein